MKFPDKITIDEKYGPAMAITTEQEAKEYWDACVEHCMRFGKSRKEAEQIERSNLGYFAGYYDSETAARVLRLFGAAHPIFGTVRPTAKEAFDVGRKMAKR